MPLGVAMLLLLFACSRPPSPAPVACPRVFLGQPGIASLPGLEWPAGGEARGLDPDLARLLGEVLDCPLQVVGTQEQGSAIELRFSLLEQGRADLSIFQISVTEERRERVAFTRPYTVDGVSLVVAEDSPVQSREELGAARIAVTEGSTAEAWVRQALPRAVVLPHPRSHQDIKDCFDAGTCDALAGDHSALSHGASRDARVRLLPGGPATREPWAIAVSKQDTALLERLDAALGVTEQDGRLPVIRARWGMPAP